MPTHRHLIVCAAFMLLAFRPAAAQQYEPTWESLDSRPIPTWFNEAKFGIFIHWGVYAVPAAGSEWYPRNMYNTKSPLFKYHKKTWGDQSEFGYKDFVPKFRAENWNPEAWAELFESAGRRAAISRSTPPTSWPCSCGGRAQVTPIGGCRS